MLLSGKIKEEKNTPIVVTVADYDKRQEIVNYLERMQVSKDNIIFEMIGLEDVGDAMFLSKIRRLLHIKKAVGKELVRVGGNKRRWVYYARRL